MLPFAILTGWLCHNVLHTVLSLASIDTRDPAYPRFLFPLQQLFASGVAFSFVGGLMAPRCGVTVAAVLAMVCVTLSWTRHVVQASDPGMNNFLHASGESIGAVAGALAVFLVTRKAEMRTKPVKP